MNEKTIIRIGSKKTQLFQKCPKCNTLIRIPKKMREFDFTPYHYWEFPYSVRCPECYAYVVVDIPEERRRINTKNNVLYAFDIGSSPKNKQFDLNALKDVKYSRQYSYVAIFEDGLQFTQAIHFDNWFESCYVVTNVDFDGNVESVIE